MRGGYQPERAGGAVAGRVRALRSRELQPSSRCIELRQLSPWLVCTRDGQLRLHPLPWWVVSGRDWRILVHALPTWIVLPNRCRSRALTQLRARDVPQRVR